MRIGESILGENDDGMSMDYQTETVVLVSRKSTWLFLYLRYRWQPERMLVLSALPCWVQLFGLFGSISSLTRTIFWQYDFFFFLRSPSHENAAAVVGKPTVLIRRARV